MPIGCTHRFEKYKESESGTPQEAEGKSHRASRGPSMGGVGFSMVRRHGVCASRSTPKSKSTGGSLETNHSDPAVLK